MTPRAAPWIIRGGTVHALAVGDFAELAAGLIIEAALDTAMRWIPRGMRIEHLRKAATAVTGTARVVAPPSGATADMDVTVPVTDAGGEEVVRAVITMYVSPARN